MALRPVSLCPADLRLRQIRAVTALTCISSPAVRLFAGVAAAADEDGLLLARPKELMEIAGVTRHLDVLLRELSANRVLEFDNQRGLPIALRILLSGDELTDELEVVARRLREARRQRG